MSARRDGARLLRLAGRTLLWGTLLLLLARGAVSVVAGPAEPPLPPPPASAAVAPFPDGEAEAFAVAFAHAYLSFDPARPEEHASALRPFLAPWLDGHAGLELPPDGGAQRVRDAFPGRAVRLGPGEGIVTLAVALAGQEPELRYLSVPLARDPSGGLAVVARPAFAPPPASARASEPAEAVLAPGERAPIEAVLTRFFPLYLAGETDDLSYFLPPGRRLRAVAGPYARVELVAVSGVGEREPNRRTVLATVRVRDETTGAAHLLDYRVRLERRERWYVAALNTR